MAGIKLNFLSDVSNFIKGTKDSADSLDKVIDSLDDLAREASSSGRTVDGELSDIARSGEKASGDLERDMRKAFDEVKKDAKDTSRKVDREFDDGMGSAGEYSGEFKDEAQANFSEIASSFDGSMESLVDLAQGTFGGLAGSLAGPIGIAAGLLAAAGGAFYASWKENAEKTEQRVQDMYQDMIDSGADFLSQEFIQQQLADIYGKTEDAVVGWDHLQEIVRRTGEREEVVALAFAGNADARQQLLDTIAEKHEELEETIVGSEGAQRDSYAQSLSVLNQYRDEIRGQASNAEDAASRTQGYRNAVQRLNTELYQVPKDVRSKVIVDYDDAVARAKLDGFISDIEARRINLTIDASLTNHGRSTL